MGSRDTLQLILPISSKAAYQRLKFDVTLALESHELMDVVDCTLREPSRQEEIPEWRKVDAEVKRVLVSGRCDEQQAAILDVDICLIKRRLSSCSARALQLILFYWGF